jgi:hypothetical protein
MRTLLLLCLTWAFAPTQAQLINGSFEQGLTGWEWTCSDPALFSGGAPGGGDWHVGKELGQTQGCFPSYLFQRLPTVQDGDVLTLSGWVRTENDFSPAYPQFGLGTVNNSVFHREETIGTTWPEWTYVEITDTVELLAGDTAVIILTSGLIGGPIAPGLGLFDALSISSPLGAGTHDQQALISYYDRTSNCLHIALGANPLTSASLIDLTGRKLPLSKPVINGSTARIDLNALPTGVYLAALCTADREHVLRFVVD